MRKVFIDVSNMVAIDFLSGIQRVVREVVLRLIDDSTIELQLISYDEKKNLFESLDICNFKNYYTNIRKNKGDIFTNRYVAINEFDENVILFDIDSVWNGTYKRSYLYPTIKERGARIITFVHDIIPVTYPQFSHMSTTFEFMDYIGSVVQFADLILCSTESVKYSIGEMCKKIGVEPPKLGTTWLGADFISNQKEEPIDKRVIKFKDKKYVLMVGTIEPRKNHKILLDAFEKCLFNTELNLIFAGRIGWNVEQLEKRIRNHSLLETKFYHLTGLNDASIDFLYKNAYMVAFPTYDEGFGLPMIEAFERGTPVVASDCPVMKEVGGEYAVYFRQDDVDDLCEKILDLYNNEELYLKLKDCVKQYKACNWDYVTNKMKTYFKEVGVQ